MNKWRGVSGSQHQFETYQLLLREAILQERVSNRPGSPEDHRRRQEDFETVHEEAIHFKLESKQDVIDERYRYRGGDSI